MQTTLEVSCPGASVTLGPCLPYLEKSSVSGTEKSSDDWAPVRSMCYREAQGADGWATGLARGETPPWLSGSSSEVFLSLTGACSLVGMGSELPKYPCGPVQFAATFFLLWPGSLHTQPLPLPAVLPPSLPPSTALHFLTFRGVISGCGLSQELLDQALAGKLGKTESQRAGAGEGEARSPDPPLR